MYVNGIKQLTCGEAEVAKLLREQIILMETAEMTSCHTVAHIQILPEELTSKQ